MGYDNVKRISERILPTITMHKICSMQHHYNAIVFLPIFFKLQFVFPPSNFDLSSGLCPLNRLYHTHHKDSRNISAERQVLFEEQKLREDRKINKKLSEHIGGGSSSGHLSVNAQQKSQHPLKCCEY